MAKVFLRVYNNDGDYSRWEQFEADAFNNSEFLSRKIRVGVGTVFADGCKIGNSVRIGVNCSIESEAVILDSAVIGDNTVIRSYVEIPVGVNIHEDEDIFFQPLFIDKGEFVISESGVNKTSIACTSRTDEWWDEHGEGHARILKRPDLFQFFFESRDEIHKKREMLGGYIPVKQGKIK